MEIISYTLYVLNLFIRRKLELCDKYSSKLNLHIISSIRKIRLIIKILLLEVVRVLGLQQVF
jgi:hypothetical protein